MLSLDLVPPALQDDLVEFRAGNGRALEDALPPEELRGLPRPLLLIEDGDHLEPTTTAVLDYCDDHLLPGDWIVVEDGNLSDVQPQYFPNYSSGPHLALKRFLARRGDAHRVEAEWCDLYAYKGTTASNGFLERIS